MSSDWWSLWWTVAAATAGLLLLWWRHYSLYFARRGLPYSPPLPLVGNFLPTALGKKSFFEVFLDLYRRHEPHSCAGIFNFNRRMVMLRDPELVRAITVKDFDHFTDHTVLLTAEDSGSPWVEKSLFNLKGKRWHDTRNTLSPAFTTMKMKNMFMLMTEIGQQMVAHLKGKTAENAASPEKGDLLTMEMKDFFTRITNDVIATTAFGLRVNSLSEPDNEFYRMGHKLTTFRGLVTLGYIMFPKLMKLLDIPLVERQAENFFKSVVIDTIKNREEKGIVRNDMLHLLMQARRGELISEEKMQDGIADKPRIQLDEEDIMAQLIVFFSAGFDTVATLMTFCSYVLATNHDIQRRLQEEVDSVMEKCGGRPGYEHVQACQYLDMVISETLRMYTPTAFLDRVCLKPYRLPAVGGSPGVELEPGDTVWVPAFGFHMDERFFPNPDHFDPERFSTENKQHIKPFTYLPFGSGPRICIAQRLALLETKVIMFHFLSEFSFQTVPKTTVPLQFDPGTAVMRIKGGTWLGVASREQKTTRTAES